MTLSSKAFGKAILIPSLVSDLEILTRIHTSMSQWIISWLVGRSRMSTPIFWKILNGLNWEFIGSNVFVGA